MCNNPEMIHLLRDEIRAELASRRAVRRAGTAPRRWRAAACAAAPALALLIAAAALAR